MPMLCVHVNGNNSQSSLRYRSQKISLHFIVLSFDRYSRDDIIGELTCALSSVPGLENADNQEISLCRKICPRSLKVSDLENHQRNSIKFLLLLMEINI